MPWSSASVPTGFLECNGQAVSRSTYSALFAIVATTYGSGDGSSTFNVPDLQDNVAMGKSGTKALASTGGANTVSNSGTVGTNINVTGNVGGSTANATLSTAQPASHSHGFTIKSGTGSPDASPGLTRANAGNANFNTNSSGSGGGHSHNMSATFSGSGNAASTFSGSANSVVQPYLTIIYIIKT